MQIETAVPCFQQRPLRRCTPRPTMVEATLRILSAAAAAHDEDPDRPIIQWIVGRVFKPAIEPLPAELQPAFRDIATDRCRRPEIHIASEGEVAITMEAWAHDQRQ